ncbi:acyltransferase domain-containing protein [Fulvivirga kasyanovii]
MGEELMNGNDTFRKTMKRLDDKAHQLIGSSVIDYIYDPDKGRSQPFDRLLYSHPAIFMVQFAMAQALIESGIKPHRVCGYSLGECVAAAVSKVADPLDILTTVINQARLVEATIPEGGMLVILADPVLYYQVPLLYTRTTLVGVKVREKHKQFVVAATKDSLVEVKNYLTENNITCHQLPVLYPYHSHHMDVLQDAYNAMLGTPEYNRPEVPFVSSIYGCELNKIDRQYWWDLIREPILFQEAIQYLEGYDANLYIDLSPSGEFASYINLLKLEGASSQVHTILNLWKRDGVRNMEKIVSEMSYGHDENIDKYSENVGIRLGSMSYE